jgi:hypothetical protein
MASDREEITHIINLYGFAIDTQDFDLFDQIFTPDIDARYSATAHWNALDVFKKDFIAYHDPFDGTQHIMSNHLIDVRGNEARCVTYAHWRLYRKGVPGGEFWEGNGWYDDIAVRTTAGWRISRRLCRIIWWGGNPLVNATDPNVQFDLPVTSLRAERQNGSVWFHTAVSSRGTAERAETGRE